MNVKACRLGLLLAALPHAAAAGHAPPCPLGVLDSRHAQLSPQLLHHTGQGGEEGFARVEGEVGAEEGAQAGGLVHAMLADLVQDGCSTAWRQYKCSI